MFSCLSSAVVVFFKSTFKKNSYRILSIRVLNSFDPDQARQFCRAWSGSKLFAKVVSRRRVNPIIYLQVYLFLSGFCTVIWVCWEKRTRCSSTRVSLWYRSLESQKSLHQVITVLRQVYDLIEAHGILVLNK